MPPIEEPSWYHLVHEEDLSLRQGDILLRFRYLLPKVYAVPTSTPTVLEEEAVVSAIPADLVVLSACCDLDLKNTKRLAIDYVLLAHHWDFDTLTKKPGPSGLQPSDRNAIESNRMPRFYLLAKSTFPEVGFELRVVDFNRVISIPRSFVDAHVVQNRVRLRMNAPYREHLAQSFAACYSRIGLPKRATQVASAPSPAEAIDLPETAAAAPEEAPAPLPGR